MATLLEIAQWMAQEFEKQGYLSQSAAAQGIMSQFGPEFVYRNKNGNFGIVPEILKKFRKLTKDNAVWMRDSQAWRKRQSYDPPGTRMVR